MEGQAVNVNGQAEAERKLRELREAAQALADAYYDGQSLLAPYVERLEAAIESRR